MFLNAEIAYLRHVTPRWFRTGYYFKTLSHAKAWAERAFNPGATVRLFLNDTNETVATVECGR